MLVSLVRVMQCPFCDVSKDNEAHFGLHVWMRHTAACGLPARYDGFSDFGFEVYEAFRKRGVEGARQVVMAYEIGGWQ